MKLHNFQADTFLANHWQQTPLFIEQGITDYTLPLSVDELAGLACEDFFTSRLITNFSTNNWQLEYGPFSEDTLSKLPDKNWTLLIQDLDKHFRAYENLLGYFDFIPRWRIDDVMVSLCPDGASVGPHVDNYDVFLYQAQGNKTWQLNQHSYNKKPLDNCDLSILENFTPEQTHHAQPGDLLYLPPGVAHHGIADEFSVTFSIGFRAPTDFDMMMAYLEEQDTSNQSRFYQDKPKVNVSAQSSWLTKSESKQLFEHMLTAIPNTQNENNFRLWQGDYLTQVKPELADFVDTETSTDRTLSHDSLKTGNYTSIQRKSCCRVLLQTLDNEIVIHINGEHFTFISTDKNLLEMLAGNQPVPISSILKSIKHDTKQDFASNFNALLNTGCFDIK